MSRKSSRGRFNSLTSTRSASSPERRPATATLAEVTAYSIERLETRLLLAASLGKTKWPLLVDRSQPIVEEAPETIDSKTGISPPNYSGQRVLDPANIVWVNRGMASDGFAARFGTSANLCRAVVDAVIVRYEQMIGSFDYPLAGQQYDLTLSMGASGGGFGASANLSTSQGGKPKSGSITMGAGNGSANANDTNGWFMDPTPFENSEFTGDIVNAFAGDAQVGSPADNVGDFFTVVAAEMTHCMGLFGNALAGWSGLTTNTGIADNASPPGFFWVFNGASVDHLLTSDNAGSQDFGSAVHSAEGPVANINFGGQNWIGAHDQGNPFYEFGRRYLVNNTFSLMFDDAYNYNSNNPASTGTMYCIYNETTDQVLVRGGDFASGHTPSNDVISVSRSGNLLSIAVNLGDDVAGTGAFSGDQNLGSFTTTFDTAVTPVASMIIQGGAGNDVISINSLTSGTPVTIQAGDGTDTINIGGGDIDTDVLSPVTVNGDAGTDSLFIQDTADGFGSDAYTVSSTQFDKSIGDPVNYATVENGFIQGSPFASTYDINGLSSAIDLTINAGAEGDTITLGGTGGDIDSSVLGSVITHGNGGVDTMHFNDATDDNSVDDSYTLTSTSFDKSSTAAQVYTFDTIEHGILTAGLADNPINVTSFSNISTGILSLLVSGNDGNDALTIGGGDCENNLAFIDVTLNGNAGNDTVTFEDTTDPEGPDAYTLTSTTFDKNTAGVNPPWQYATFEDIVINCNGFDNDVTITNFSTTENVTVNGNGGNDTFHQAAGSLDMNTNWNGNLTINGGAGASDSIVLDDSGDLTGDAYALTPTTFQVSAGLTTNPFVYGTVELFTWLLNTNPTPIGISGTALDTTYTINASDGNDRFNVGTGNLDAFDGPLTINGNIGTDDVVVDDSLAAFSDTYTLTNNSLARNVFAGMNYGTVESFVLNAETGNNVINVDSTLAATPVTVNGNAGNDSLIIASAGGDWDLSVLGNVVFQGGPNTDSIRINDTGDDAGADTYTVTNTNTIKSSGGGTISYATTESYLLDANNFNNTINVNSSFAGTFRVHGNGGADTINLLSSAAASFVTIDGGTGLDNVNVNSDGAGTAIGHFDTTQDLAALTILAGGTQVMELNGSRVIDTDGLTIAATGRLDMTDNDLIVDYVGATQMAVITALINLGRAGGLWNGFGITSSAAQTNPLDNTTLGRMEGSEFDVIYGAAALFSGRSVDNTAVLVKYTYYGDADFSGLVTFDDYARIDAGFSGSHTGWLNGDFDGSGSVNFDDYSLIDLAFNTQGAAL